MCFEIGKGSIQMNSRIVNISSLILLLSLISFITEAIVYYFIPAHWVSVIFAGIISLAVTHFCLETSLDYDYGFIHASFMVIFSLAFATIIYLIQPNQWISYDFSMVFLVLINWLVPLIYNIIRDLLDHGPRFYGFRTFFRRMALLFFVIYAMVIIKQYFITPIVPPYHADAFGAHNFVPFMSLGSNLENMLRSGNHLIPFVCYVTEIVTLGIPFGFFLRTFFRKSTLCLRVLLYILYPAVLEVLQYITGRGRYDLDDISLSLIGILLGVLLFHLINAIFRATANREFMMNREKFSTYFTSM